MRPLIAALLTFSFLQCISINREVIISGNGVSLAGTLVTPGSKTPEDVVIMVTGSGPQDRDETIMGHKPFKVIADSLATHGIASLRLDDRGVGASTGNISGNTVDMLNSDITRAIAYVDSLYPESRIGILGHSQGGTIAIRQGAHNPRVGYIITLAAPAWAGDSLIMSQSRAIAVAHTGRWDAEHDQRYIMDVAKSPLPAITARTLIYNHINAKLGDTARLPQVQEQVTTQINAVCSDYYREMLRYDPADDIKHVNIPWLALNGTKDIQVLIGNLETIRNLNPKAHVIECQGMNHLFQPAITGLMNEYSQAVPTPDPQVITTIINWIKH